MTKTFHCSIRCILSILAALLVTIAAESGTAELRTYVKEYSYRASKVDGKESSRVIACREVEKLLLEELAVDIGKMTEAREVQLTKDQIVELSAGIVKMDIENERWHARTYQIRAKIEADPGELIKRLGALLKEEEKAKELERLRTQSDDLLRGGERLRKEFSEATGKKRTSVKAAYDEQIRDIKAVDYYQKGFINVNLGKYDQAIKDISAAIELNPKEGGAYYNRGLAYAELRQYLQASQDYTRAIELNPKFGAAHIRRGFALLYMGQYDSALDDFDSAIALNQKLAAAYVGRGIVNADRGNFDHAIKDYDKAIDVDRGFAAAYSNRGLANYSLGRYDQALHDFNTVIGLEPNMARAYVYRGLAYYNLGKYDQAIEDYNAAIKLDQKQARAYYNLARIYSLQDNHEKALYNLEAAIKIDQSLKNMAKKENDFDRTRNLPEFIKLIGP